VLRGKQIVLGVTGSIAAYKALMLVRQCVVAGIDVWPLLTDAACRFVGPLSFSALAGRHAITSLWDVSQVGAISHVELAARIDALVIAPATADTLARLAQGRADDPLTSVALSTRAPLVVAPAMETGMWEHAATQASVAQLTARGVTIVPPTSGDLASGRSGVGRMAEPEMVMSFIRRTLTQQDFAGTGILVTAGPTREWLDPVRFISNPSTGRMGFAVAQAAWERGARVHLVCGPTEVAPPPVDHIDTVTTTQEMFAACEKIFPSVQLVIMAAAPADFAPDVTHPDKVKKGSSPRSLAVAPTVDIIGALAKMRRGQRLVGFAAETTDLPTNAQAKLRAKNLDLIVANKVRGAEIGFAAETNAAEVFDRNGNHIEIPAMPKIDMAHRLLDIIGGTTPR
jgi:phosphopantothenoylcysteine decarboxylase / phosphopantothenate---cysteine ligase